MFCFDFIFDFLGGKKNSPDADSPVSNARFDFGSPNGSPNRSVRFSDQVVKSECDFTLQKSDVTVTNKYKALHSIQG